MPTGQDRVTVPPVAALPQTVDVPHTVGFDPVHTPV